MIDLCSCSHLRKFAHGHGEWTLFSFYSQALFKGNLGFPNQSPNLKFFNTKLDPWVFQSYFWLFAYDFIIRHQPPSWLPLYKIYFCFLRKQTEFFHIFFAYLVASTISIVLLGGYWNMTAMIKWFVILAHVWKINQDGGNGNITNNQ